MILSCDVQIAFEMKQKQIYLISEHKDFKMEIFNSDTKLYVFLKQITCGNFLCFYVCA